MANGILRVAGAQIASVEGGVEENLFALTHAARKAAENGADLIVFPELFVSGYNAGDLLPALAEVNDGSVFQYVSGVASRLNIAICYGYPELCDGRIYNSARLVGADGASLINHRKTHLFGEYEKKQFAEGDGPVSCVMFRGVLVAVLICYEIEFPELARMVAQCGAQVILAPTAVTAENNPNEVAQLLARARAAENNIFVAYVNHASSTEADGYQGASIVAGPLGAIEAQSRISGDEIIYAELNMASLTDAEATLPYLSDLRQGVFAQQKATRLR